MLEAFLKRPPPYEPHTLSLNLKQATLTISHQSLERLVMKDLCKVIKVVAYKKNYLTLHSQVLYEIL